MSVKFYDRGEHPAGFIGYRVARTIGHSKDLRQKYFGFSMYSPREAESLAYELDEKWRLEAIEVRKERGLVSGTARAGVGNICMGFRAGFAIESKRGAEPGFNLRPVFFVDSRVHGQNPKEFCISVHGFTNAYKLAARYYAKERSLDDLQKESLIQKKIPKSIFTADLAEEYRKRGYVIHSAKLKATISFENLAVAC